MHAIKLLTSIFPGSTHIDQCAFRVKKQIIITRTISLGSQSLTLLSSLRIPSSPLQLMFSMPFDRSLNIWRDNKSVLNALFLYLDSLLPSQLDISSVIPWTGSFGVTIESTFVFEVAVALFLLNFSPTQI